jgi:alpha-L-fucosidase 2
MRTTRNVLTTGVAALALLTALNGAAAGQCLPMAVGNEEGNYLVPGVRGNIVYRRVDGAALALDAYVQQSGTRRPAVIVVHGGTWDSGSRIAFTGQFLELLTRAGYNWFAVDYRLNGLARFTEAIDDLRAALAFVRCHAAEFRIDPDNVGIFGEDAGAQLALWLGAEPPDGVKAVVSVGGFYDLAGVDGLKSHPAELLARASPAMRDLQRMPPTLVIHGGGDSEVPLRQADEFCHAVGRAGRSCEFLGVEDAIHRPENWRPSQQGYKARLTAWLARTLSLPAANHKPYVTRLQKDVVFSPAHRLALDAWTPAGPGPFPAVIIAHGGGWEAGDKVTYVTPVFEPLARAGFAWFSIDYRLTPEFRNQDQLDDLRAAVQFVRANAHRFRIDPRRIAIVGESASGQMVAQLATDPIDGVAAVVSFYGVYDFLQMTASFAPRSVPARLFGLTEMNAAARDVLTRFSPLHQAKRGMPPLLLLQGTADRLHAQAVAFSVRLDQIAADYERYDVPGAPHGVENWEGHPEWMSYKKVLVDWLSRKLAGAF